MLLLSLAIAPGLAIALFFIYRDLHNREPARDLFFTFVLGMLSIIPALFIELALDLLKQPSVVGTLVSAYLFVALVEEGCKFAVLRGYSFPRRSFDEPLDGIIYSVMVSMGFATVENILYVVFDEQSPVQTGVMRMFTAVPAHATFAIIMGYYVGKAKFDAPRRGRLLLTGLLLATLAHGTYDAFLFLIENNWVRQFVSELLLFGGALASLLISIRLSRKLVRLHRATSRQLFVSEPVLTIRHAGPDDIHLLRTLALQIWPSTYAPILPRRQIDYMMDMIYSPAALRQQIEEEKHQFILVYNAGHPIGFASYNELEPGLYKLQKIYVHPQQQGRGTGRFVINQVLNDIRPRGARYLQLNVNRHNTAKGFYEKLGFRVIREEDIDIGNEYYMNDYVMEMEIAD